MNIEATIKDLKNYMAFSNKKENFSKEEEFIHHKNIADRIGIVITAYEKEKEKNIKLKKDKEILYEVIDEIKEEIE